MEFEFSISDTARNACAQLASRRILSDNEQEQRAIDAAFTELQTCRPHQRVTLCLSGKRFKETGGTRLRIMMESFGDGTMGEEAL